MVSMGVEDDPKGMVLCYSPSKGAPKKILGEGISAAICVFLAPLPT